MTGKDKISFYHNVSWVIISINCVKYYDWATLNRRNKIPIVKEWFHFFGRRVNQEWNNKMVRVQQSGKPYLIKIMQHDIRLIVIIKIFHWPSYIREQYIKHTIIWLRPYVYELLMNRTIKYS